MYKIIARTIQLNLARLRSAKSGGDGGDGHAEDRAHAKETRKHVEEKSGSWEPGAVLSTPSQYSILISRNTLNLISVPEPLSFAHPKP